MSDDAWSTMSDTDLMSSLESPEEALEPVEQEHHEGEALYGEEEFEEVEEHSSDEDIDVDYESEYKRLLSPFKANGMEMQVDNVEQAVRLMQMGANYNQRMAELKPQRKVIAMLEKQGLLDEGKLNHLIDIHLKKPEAISKFLRDSEISTYDLDTEAEYTPTDHGVSDEQMSLNDVLDEVKSTPYGGKTLDVIQKWDSKSVDHMVSNPESIRVINNHMENGVYDKVMAEVARRKVFGTAPNVPDYQLYYQVGSEMAEQGMFNADAKQPEVIKGSNDSRSKVVERKQKMNAVRQPKQSNTGVTFEKDLADMSDDEVMAWVEAQ